MQTKSLKTKSLLIATCLMGVISSVQAETVGPFIEPAFTLESGSTDTNYPSPLRNADGDVDGFGFGIRGGFHITDVLFLGLDGRYSFPNYEDSAANYDASATASNWGPVIGVQLPVVGLRAWGSVILGGQLDPKKSGSFDVRFEDASGFRIGAGFKIVAVSLNLEYQHINYDRSVLEQVGPFSSNSALNGVEVEQNTLIASVSIPLAF